MTFKPDYPFEGEPHPGETREVADGIWWIRMPLPFALNHINLWLLDDGDGWTIVDTGVKSDEIKACWKTIEARHFTDKPVKRVIVTHFHPDHVGLAGWLCERYGVELTMSLAEWIQARLNAVEPGELKAAAMHPFYARIGFDEEQLALLPERGGYFKKVTTIPPDNFNRMEEGDEITIGGHAWRVILTEGHALKHACLYCAEKNILISGDQVLPRITTNVSVYPQEPEANPLHLFLTSMAKFKGLPADTLVLPSHDWPFRGLHGRLAHMVEHHDERLDEALEACAGGATAIDVLNRLFTRKLDNHQIFFAIGEALAHLHYLMGQGRVQRETGPDGVYRFRAI